jgi:uncharacterized membrane protein YdjX (TVP38/TMEM64 family)
VYVLRILAVLLLIAVGFSFLAYVLSGRRRYLDFAGRLTRYGLLFALVFFALMFLERALLIPL